MMNKIRKITKMHLAFLGLSNDKQQEAIKLFCAENDRSRDTLFRVFNKPDRAIGAHIDWLSNHLKCDHQDAFKWVDVTTRYVEVSH
jgi:hypothetical protein